MLGPGEDSDSMEQAQLNQVFSLFGKGVTQMLQQVMNMQTVIDELRANNRSLQTQVANLTSSLDEIEDRVLVRVQNTQQTIYTREGVPIDDALDTLKTKLDSVNQRVVEGAETFAKIDAELAAKVDKEDFEATSAETLRVSDACTELVNGVNAMQKDIKKLKKDNETAQERMLKAVKLQVQSQNLKDSMKADDVNAVEFVTKKEMKEAIAKAKFAGGSGAGGDGSMESSAVVEYALSGDGPDEEKVKTAFAMLQQKKAKLEQNYAAETEKLAQDMARLVKIAEGGGVGGGGDEDDDYYDDDYYDYDYDEAEGEGEVELDENGQPIRRSHRSGAAAGGDGEVELDENGRPIRRGRRSGAAAGGDGEVELDENGQPIRRGRRHGGGARGDGEVELDENGQPTRRGRRHGGRHGAGEVVLDENGQPIRRGHRGGSGAAGGGAGGRRVGGRRVPVERKFYDVGLDTNNNFERGQVMTRMTRPGANKRCVGLANHIKYDKDGKIDMTQDDSAVDIEDMPVELDEDDYEGAGGGSRRRHRRRLRDGSQGGGDAGGKGRGGASGGKMSLLEQMKRSQAEMAERAKAGPGQPGSVDEIRITQKVLEAVIPRVETLLVENLSGGGGGSGQSGSGGPRPVRLERHEAKHLVDQLSLLETIKEELKNQGIKIGLKMDRGRAESELKLRITRDEFFNYMAAMFPDNEIIKRMMSQDRESKLPPLANRSQSEMASVKAVAQSQDNPARQKQQKGRYTVRPGRNSNMMALNQKFCRGDDGKYYLRDIGIEQVAQPTNATVVGSDDIDASADFEFQRFTGVDANPGNPQLRQMRELTPMNTD